MRLDLTCLSVHLSKGGASEHEPTDTLSVVFLAIAYVSDCQVTPVPISQYSDVL